MDDLASQVALLRESVDALSFVVEELLGVVCGIALTGIFFHAFDTPFLRGVGPRA